MEHYIEYTAERMADRMRLTITGQGQINEEFNPGVGDEDDWCSTFQAEGQVVRLSSDCFPEWEDGEQRLFVWGCDARKNAESVAIPMASWPDVELALRAYNQHYSSCLVPHRPEPVQDWLRRPAQSALLLVESYTSTTAFSGQSAQSLAKGYTAMRMVDSPSCQSVIA